ncbi:MAG: DNA repair protein RadC [Acidobacteriota bacterium]
MPEAVARLIRELPSDERPRERLLANGAGSLADSELIAVLLRTGRIGVSALELGRELLRESGGLEGLLGIRPEALRRRGLGEAKSAALLAAVEVGRRLARGQIPDREPMLHPAAVARYLLLRYAVADQEIMGALYLDVRHRLLGEREIYRGTLNRAAVEPRGLLKEGLLRGAAALVLFHTHPSGDPSPSAEDLVFTRRLAEAGDLIGVKLLDHLVLGATGAWVSLRERGGWA